MWPSSLVIRNSVRGHNSLEQFPATRLASPSTNPIWWVTNYGIEK
ncbi:hypothetical protein OIU84_023085, partial [Salix udensis]